MLALVSAEIKCKEYGNMGCGVFKGGGGTKLERVLPKNQHTLGYSKEIIEF